MEDPKSTTASVCVNGSVLFAYLLGVSRSMEREPLNLSVLSNLWILFKLLYSTICSCMLVVLVWLSVLDKWLARKIPLVTHLYGEITATKPIGRGCVNFSGGLCVCLFPSALHNIYFIRLWYDITYLC